MPVSARFVALVVVAALLIAAACSSEPTAADDAAIEASDGAVNAVLHVPDGALSNDADAGEIEISLDITAPTRNELGLGGELPVASVVIDLQPSGLVFEDPVALDLTLPPALQGVVIPILESDGRFEVLTTAPVDPPPSDSADAPVSAQELDETQLRVMVPHFSELQLLVVRKRWPSEILQGPPDRDIVVGERFTVRVSVDRPSMVLDSLTDRRLQLRVSGGEATEWGDLSDITSEGGRFLLRADRGERWRMAWDWVDFGGTDLFSFDENGTFTAVSPYRSDARGDFDGNDGAVLEMTYTCRQPGEFSIRFNPRWLGVIALVEAVGDSEVFTETVEVSLIGQIQWMPGRCVAPPPTPTPTPTPDPSVTDSDRQTVLMVVVDGMYYPASQFDVLASGAPEPGHSCTRPHYHAKDAAELAVGLVDAGGAELDFFGDPDPSGCGFGRFDELERVNVELDADQLEALLEWLASPL